MNPLRVTASNYRTFADLDVELPMGCVAIVGENGAGKSSILNLVDVALFADRGELPPLLTAGEERLELQLEFEHAGELHRVRRSYSAAGRGKATLDFEVTDGPLGEWRPLTRENTAQTQELIEQTLGLSRTTFRASAFLRQGDGAAFTEAQPRDRKAILAEILGLGLWDRMLDRARSDLRAVEAELAGSAAMTARLEQTVADRGQVTAERDHIRHQRDGAAELVVDAEVLLEQAQEQLAAVAAKNERVLRLGAELGAAQQDRDRLHSKLAEITAAADSISDVGIELGDAQADAARIPQLGQELAALQEATRAAADATRRRDELAAQVEQRELARQRLVDQAFELHTSANDFRAKAQHLDDHIGEASACDRCGQTLGAEAAARAARSYRDEAVTLDQRAAEIDTQAATDLEEIAGLHEQIAGVDIPEPVDPLVLEAYGERLAWSRAAAEKRGQLQERLAGLERLAADRPQVTIAFDAAAALVAEREAAYTAAQTDIGDLSAAERAVDEAKRTASGARVALEQRAGELARAEQRLEQIVAAQAELDQLRAQTASLHTRADLLNLAERAYGRDGIPALIVESAAIPQLEVEANRIIGELGGSTADCRIELRTQRALKTSDQLRETLDIVIRTPVGDREYETFSGGERTRLNLALRIALARLLAHRRGAESRLLAIDEPDGLDAQGMDALASVLSGLTGDFEKVLVVSHQPQLATSFDSTLQVEKDGDRSRIRAEIGALELVT